MLKVDIAGLHVNGLSKQEFLDILAQRLSSGQKTFVTTPYSEFLYVALRDREVMAMLNRADIAIPDGIGILWAQRFLSLPFSFKNYYLKIFQALWQMVYSGAGILLRPKSVYRFFPAKLTGADIVWDIAALAERDNHSIYLLGGFGDTPRVAAQKLQQRFPKLNIVGTSNKHQRDQSIIGDVQAAKPDILLVAFGPIKQEQWIVDHYDQLPVKMMIGLGGTFDYLAGKVSTPPRFIRSIGLEWLYRLVTQPQRFKRIFQATIGLITALVRHKVFDSQPYRLNAASIVFNEKNEVLIAQRNPNDPDLIYVGYIGIEAKFDNYWQFPQGGVPATEQIITGAQRELKEETNIVSVEAITVSDATHSYAYPHARRPLWGNRYRNKGQSQRVIYFRFTGAESEIKIDNDEFINYQWVPIDQLRKIVHPERWPLIDIIERDIKDHKILEDKSGN